MQDDDWLRHIRPFRLAAISSAPFLVAACATYEPHPLPNRPDLVAILPVESMPLDMNDVATIAVLNSPDLKAARAKAQVGAAQAFAAGLLPDPQFTANLDHPTDQGGGFVDAYGLGLIIDMQALLTQPAKIVAASAAREQTQLDLLWQEWQTVAEARTLCVQNSIGAEKQRYFSAAEGKYAMQAARSTREQQAGDVTFEQAGSDVATLFDVRSRRGAAERSVMQADQALHALLGIAPTVSIHLQTLGDPEVLDHATVTAALDQLAQRRPDLRALQAGYRNQEKLFLKSVLSQFPNISVGFSRARDTSDVHTAGFSVSLSLPLFDRGRGEIAVQRATREQLRAEYQARLDQATIEAWRLWTEAQQLLAQIQDLKASLPQLLETVEKAEHAYEAGDVTVSAYLTLLNTLLNGQSDLFDLRISLWSNTIALSTVLGTQIEPAGNKKDVAR